MESYDCHRRQDRTLWRGRRRFPCTLRQRLERSRVRLGELLGDYVTENNPVRIVDVFIDELDLGKLGSERVQPAKTGRPSYHPTVLLKLDIYGYPIRATPGLSGPDREPLINCNFQRKPCRKSLIFKSNDFRDWNKSAFP